MRRRTQVKNVKKTVLAVLTAGLLVGGMTGEALAKHNKPNLAATGHPGYAPDYYYPLVSAQSGPTQNGRIDIPASPNWMVQGSSGASSNPQSATTQQLAVPFVTGNPR